MYQNAPNGSICFIIFLEVPPCKIFSVFFHRNPLPCLCRGLAGLVLWRPKLMAQSVFSLTKMQINIAQSCVVYNRLCTEWYKTVCMQSCLLGAQNWRPWKSSGTLVKFYLRAECTSQNWRICNVFLWWDPLRFAWALRNSHGQGPGPQLTKMSTKGHVNFVSQQFNLTEKNLYLYY